MHVERRIRQRAWTWIVFIQDFSIACILSGIIALVMSTDDWTEFGIILFSCFILIKLFDNVIYAFFDGLANNNVLRKYLFGSNNGK